MDIAISPARRLPNRQTETSPQTAPKPLVLHYALAVTHAVRILTGLRLAALGIASGQDRMLIALNNQPSISVSALAEELAVRPSTISKMADRLAAKNFLRRLVDTSDARKTRLALTPESQIMAQKVVDVCDQIEAEITRSLSEGEISAVLEGLAILDGSVSNRLRKLR